MSGKGNTAAPKVKRKAISKKTRFEVFKRDSFTCQYCGAQSPDVVLHVDHINPVAGGGSNDILNLITSCEPCNLGKGAKALDDKSSLAKQRAQLDELNERREQLEMMVQWRESMANLDDEKIGIVERAFSDATGFGLSEHGRAQIRLWLKKHPIADILQGLDGSLATYFRAGSADEETSRQMAQDAFGMVVRVINAHKRYSDKPYMRDLFYTRAIIRSRMHCNEREAIRLLEECYLLGAHIEELKDWARDARNWTNWRTEMESWAEELRTAGEPE